MLLESMGVTGGTNLKWAPAVTQHSIGIRISDSYLLSKKLLERTKTDWTCADDKHKWRHSIMALAGRDSNFSMFFFSFADYY